MSFSRTPTLWWLLAISALCLVTAHHGVAQEAVTPTASPSTDIPKPQLSPEAMVAVRRGEEYLQKKEFKKAIEMFKLAARLHPKEGRLRHTLGFAYLQDKQLGQAWLQYRQCVRLAPGFARGVRYFEVLWQAFEAQGVLQCGRSSQEIAKYLGKPDAVVPVTNGDQEVWVYGFKEIVFQKGKLAVVVDPRGVDKSQALANNRLDIQFDDQSRWRPRSRSVNRIQSLTNYVPSGQSVTKWNELYVIQRLYHLAKKQTPATMMKSIEENLKKANPNVEFVVLAEREDDVLFHWRDVGDQSTKRIPQHEIVRLIADDHDIHRIAYAQRVAQIPTETAQLWAGILQKAKLVPTETAAPASAPK